MTLIIEISERWCIYSIYKTRVKPSHEDLLRLNLFY